jgi:hypothetical protein
VKLNIVPARTGIQWVKLGIQTFFRKPLALASLFFMYMVVVLLISFVPVIGAVVVVVLLPAATVGMLVATEQAAQGGVPMPPVLLSAFRAGRQRARSMLILGAIYAGVLVAITLLAVLLFPGGAGMEATPAQGNTPPQLQFKPGFLFAMALQLPLVVLFSHAPALVHWYEVSPVKSLFFSLVAFWRNLGAFVVFGLSWVLLLLGVALLMRVLFDLLGPMATVVVWPVALTLFTMMAMSMYFSFRDCFVASADEEPQPAPPGGASPP